MEHGHYQKQGILFRENNVIGNRPISREYDFIVIGASTGSCAVINRISKHSKQPNWSILLLEFNIIIK